MNLKKFIKLCAVSKKILLKYKNSKKISAIRQLYLMRPHPVLMREYYSDQDKYDEMIDDKNLFVRIINLVKNYFQKFKNIIHLVYLKMRR